VSNDLVFNLKGDFIELFKLVKLLGLAETGGMAKLAIEHGEAKVDGKVETRKACKIRAGQTVEFDGKIIKVGHDE